MTAKTKKTTRQGVGPKLEQRFHRTMLDMPSELLELVVRTAQDELERRESGE